MRREWLQHGQVRLWSLVEGDWRLLANKSWPDLAAAANTEPIL